MRVVLVRGRPVREAVHRDREREQEHRQRDERAAGLTLDPQYQAGEQRKDGADRRDPRDDGRPAAGERPEATGVRELQRDSGAERERQSEEAQHANDHRSAAREREREGNESRGATRL